MDGNLDFDVTMPCNDSNSGRICLKYFKPDRSLAFILDVGCDGAASDCSVIAGRGRFRRVGSFLGMELHGICQIGGRPQLTKSGAIPVPKKIKLPALISCQKLLILPLLISCQTLLFLTPFLFCIDNSMICMSESLTRRLSKKSLVSAWLNGTSRMRCVTRLCNPPLLLNSFPMIQEATDPQTTKIKLLCRFPHEFQK